MRALTFIYRHKSFVTDSPMAYWLGAHVVMECASPRHCLLLYVSMEIHGVSRCGSIMAGARQKRQRPFNVFTLTINQLSSGFSHLRCHTSFDYPEFKMIIKSCIIFYCPAVLHYWWMVGWQGGQGQPYRPPAVYEGCCMSSHFWASSKPGEGQSVGSKYSDYKE